MDGYVIPSPSSKYNANLLPYESTFQNPLQVNTLSGTGVVSLDPDYTSFGTLALHTRVTSTTPMVFNFGNSLKFTAPYTGKYNLSFDLLHMLSTYAAHQFKINIEKNASFSGLPEDLITFTLPTDANPQSGIGQLNPEQFYLFAGEFSAEAGDVIDFQFTQANAASGAVDYFISQLKVSFNNSNSAPGYYTPPANYPQASAYYEYGNTPLNNTTVTTSFTTLLNDGGNIQNGIFFPYMPYLLNVSTSKLDLTKLEVGDCIEASFVLDITTTLVNQTVDIDIVFGQGGVGSFRRPLMPQMFFAAIGVHSVNISALIPIVDAVTRNNPMAFEIKSSASATVFSNVWSFLVTKMIPK